MDVGLSALIDHTLLRPDATRRDVERHCREAIRWRFAAVCVNPNRVALCARLLARSGVRVCAVIGFPLGAARTAIKEAETRLARRDGAREFDMVIDIGALKSGDDALVRRDIAAVVRAAGRGAIVKAILETALLTDAEKRRACRLARLAGARFVKTSTGASGGATEGDVRLLRRAVGFSMGVKASGGIRDAEAARRMIRAGASRLGCSASVKIMRELEP